jgi:hypothetical protein
MSYSNQPPYPQQPDPYQQPQPYPQQPNPYEAPYPQSPQPPPQPLYPQMPDPHQGYPPQAYPQQPYQQPQPQYPPQYPQQPPYPQPNQPAPNYPPQYGQMPPGAPPPYNQAHMGPPYPPATPGTKLNLTPGTQKSIAAGVVVAAVIILGIIVVPHLIHNTPTSTVTPPFYASSVPSCTDASKWNASTSVQKTCNATTVQLSVASSAGTLGEIFLNLKSFPSSYTVKVHISNLTSGCAGASVLRTDYEGYDGFVCADNTWKIVRYDTTGNPTTEQSGKLAGSASDYQMELDLANGKLVMKVNNATLGSPVAIMAGYSTAYLSLVIDYAGYTSGVADFNQYEVDLA